METGIADFLMFAAFIVAIGLLVVINLYREVGHKIKQKSVVVLALSTGIIAFSLKVLAVVTMSHLPPEIALSDNPLKQLTRAYVAPEFAKSRYSDRYQWQALPLEVETPQDNPLTEEKIALGKQLFYDKRLSADNSVSCASCHQLTVEKGGADGVKVAKGIAQKLGNRNTPTVLNAAFQSKFFWDARIHSLEEQAAGPIFNPVEMGMENVPVLVEKLSNVAKYTGLFEAAFGDSEITLKRITQAIASYERTLITPNTAYDQFVRGDSSALTASQKRGMVLFEQTGCVLCHSGPNFSGASYLSDSGYETFVFPAMAESPDISQFDLLKDKGLAGMDPKAERAIWRVPSLRNVSLTAPYFHNGSIETLQEAVRIVAEVQLDKVITEKSSERFASEWIAEKQQFSVRSNPSLSEQEVDDIVAFLQALEGNLEVFNQN